MDSPMSSAPLTPLGARTPHPGLYIVSGILVVIIVLGVVWVVWTRPANAPEPSVSASLSPGVTAILSYRSNSFGFSITLPNDWKGYTVLSQQWDGTDVASGNVTQHGARIVLRHPLWTAAKPYEDLPVLVFTPAQWALVQNESLSLGAAPIGPSELGRNSKFVFALPARYNFDYSLGWEEADAAVHTLLSFEPNQ